MSVTRPFVRVARLREILAELRDGDVLATRTKANTGNLPVLREIDGSMVQVGYIDVFEGSTRIEWYDDESLPEGVTKRQVAGKK